MSANHPRTLADCCILLSRCSNCGYELPLSTAVEFCPTESSDWVIAKCPKCGHCTPFKLEKAS